MRMWLRHDCCDYTCVNDINSAYMVDEVMRKCVEMIINVQNCVVVKPYRHVETKVEITPC
jgi:hypothetical protein